MREEEEIFLSGNFSFWKKRKANTKGNTKEEMLEEKKKKKKKREERKKGCRSVPAEKKFKRQAAALGALLKRETRERERGSEREEPQRRRSTKGTERKEKTTKRSTAARKLTKAKALHQPLPQTFEAREEEKGERERERQESKLCLRSRSTSTQICDDELEEDMQAEEAWA